MDLIIYLANLFVLFLNKWALDTSILGSLIILGR